MLYCVCYFRPAVPKLFGCRPGIQIRDLISVRGPAYFVYWKKQHAHHHSRLYTGIVIYFICSETYLQCDLWNWSFCCTIVVVFGTMLDAAIRRVSCIWNSVSKLGFTIFNLRNELFPNINTSKYPNQFRARFEILGDTLCKAAEAFLIEMFHSDPSHSAIQ